MPKITGEENKFSTFELKRPESRQIFNLDTSLDGFVAGNFPVFHRPQHISFPLRKDLL